MHLRKCSGGAGIGQTIWHMLIEGSGDHPRQGPAFRNNLQAMTIPGHKRTELLGDIFKSGYQDSGSWTEFQLQNR